MLDRTSVYTLQLRIRDANITIASIVTTHVAAINCHSFKFSSCASENSSSGVLFVTEYMRLMLAMRSIPALNAQRKQKNAMVDNWICLNVKYPSNPKSVSSTNPQKSP